MWRDFKVRKGFVCDRAGGLYGNSSVIKLVELNEDIESWKWDCEFKRREDGVVER